MITFQKVISLLTEFWADRGCAISQGHDVEVGAGTFNPATFLRSLGPESFNTVYVEPSRRPQDARFGENPNRLQLFHQLQVILKPSPLDIQNLYLQSLELIGVDRKKHDIRFVHDDWESPTLGASGLGWEVWIDGMEITQFTYFQQVAGIQLSPITVEITYGLERLCMIVQNKDSFFDMMYSEHLSYKDIYHRNEVEWSHYNFYHASTKMWLAHFNDFEKEAKTIAELHFPIPAYDFVMKASHAFNMLEARGVLSTTERTGYITRIRNLAKLCADEYLLIREEMKFPLLAPIKSTQKKSAAKEFPSNFDPKKTDDFLFEIRSEELPAVFIWNAKNNLEKAIEKLLRESSLDFDSITSFGTPRRLSVYAKGLSHGTCDQNIERKGPLIDICFDSSGNLSKQGQGFIKSLGIDSFTLQDLKDKKVSGVTTQIIKEKEYLFANLQVSGKSTFAILAKSLPSIIESLPFPKKMHWADLDVSYARPIQSIIALFGKEVIPFSFARIESGRETRGHFQLSDEVISIAHPTEYLNLLRKNKVIADIEERKQSITSQLDKLEKENHFNVIQKDAVLKQVLYLSEYPMLMIGTFDQNFLKAPKEVLTSEMVEHQKYFPTENGNHALLNKFIITADNTPNDTIRSGNEKVLSARLSDGVFLYEADCKVPLSTFLEKLKTVTFQKELGSIFDKQKKLTSIALSLSSALHLSTDAIVKRAAELCKVDLASELVAEFPDLQGTIGKYYALHEGENKDVAIAIEEHYLPRFENDILPSSPTGIIVSLADKLHNLVGYFSINLIPTSSSDPFAIRRQTLGILRILIENKLSINLSDVFTSIGKHFPKYSNATNEKLLPYLKTRLAVALHSFGFAKDEIDASMSDKSSDPFDQYLKVKALNEFRKGPAFSKLFEVYKRAKGQLQHQAKASIQKSNFVKEQEKNLYNILLEISPLVDKATQEKSYVEAFSHLSKLQKPLSDLFEHVQILSDNAAHKANRIALLQEVFSLFSKLLDFSKIQEKK